MVQFYRRLPLAVPLFYGNVILPFVDRFPKDTEMYRVMTTKPMEMAG